MFSAGCSPPETYRYTCIPVSAWTPFGFWLAVAVLQFLPFSLTNFLPLLSVSLYLFSSYEDLRHLD